MNYSCLNLEKASKAFENSRRINSVSERYGVTDVARAARIVTERSD